MLDSLIEPRPSAPRAARQAVRARGFTHVLDAVLKDCDAAGPARCALAGGDRTATEKFSRLVDRLREGPVGTGPDAVTFSDFVMGAQDALQTRSKFAPFLAAVEDFYESTFGSAPRVGSHRADAASAYGYNILDAYWGTKCVDGPMPQGQQQYYGIAERFDRRYPMFGSWELFNDVGCATWPGMGQERYAGPWDRPTAVPILVVGQTLDPNTPYSNSLRLTGGLGQRPAARGARLRPPRAGQPVRAGRGRDLPRQRGAAGPARPTAARTCRRSPEASRDSTTIQPRLPE